MDRYRISSSKTENYIKKIFIFSIFCGLSSMIMVSGYAISFNQIDENHNKSGNISDMECVVCHLNRSIENQTKSIMNSQSFQNSISSSIKTHSTQSSGNNYTAILTIGQNPFQLGPFMRTDLNPNFNGAVYTGWSWWDAGIYGTEKKKNLITLMVLNNSQGTVKPVKGLVTLPTYPQVTRRNHSANYSYKADTTDPTITYKWDSTGTVIYAENHYEDNKDLRMIKQVDLTGATSANLSFWTWFTMETNWDYGYVAVSMNNGNSWTNLPGVFTTNTNPNGNNLGNGITGSSSGWVQENMNLSPYAGNKILLAFRFKSDAYVNDEGMYVDDINVTSNNGLILSDDAETIKIVRTLSVNVTYPNLVLINITDPLTNSTILQYTRHTRQIDLQEDISHPGTYNGYFIYETIGEQYSGNYTVTFNAELDGTAISTSEQFQTTIFGCQGCHNKKHDSYNYTPPVTPGDSGYETSFIHTELNNENDLACMYSCHGASRGHYFGKTDINANPIHIHEMQYGHQGGFLPGSWHLPQTPYDVPSHVSSTSCVQCHTSFLHDNTGTDTAAIANYTLKGTNISFSKGSHINLSCENCHGTLNYPAIPENQYLLQDTIGNYNPTYTSHESFTNTYIIAVNGTENINITISGNNTTKSILLYTIGPVDNTSMGLQGPCTDWFSWAQTCEKTQSLETPINLNITNPYTGTWIAKIFQLQEGTIDYTISSNYPLQRKPIIKIPECNNCHNSNAVGIPFTKTEIPDWNPGFAHVDANNDGTLDIQCRMCHDSMHDITIKDCHNCHTTAPTSHPIAEPAFSQWTASQCLSCHGDPHRVTAGGSCIGCHSIPGTRYYVNGSLFGKHGNISKADTNVTDEDCLGCHFGAANITMTSYAGPGAASSNNTYLCEDCHTSGGRNTAQYVNISLPYRKSAMPPGHGRADCEVCHIAGYSRPRPLQDNLRYHTGGPWGTAT